MPPMSVTTSCNFNDSSSSVPAVEEQKPLQEKMAEEQEATSTQTTSSSNNKKRCRSVRFAKNLDVKEVPHVKDMTEEEMHETWYTQEDFALIKKSMVITIRLMMASKPISNDQTSRGLEFRTPTGAKQRKKNKLDALTAVWNEQVSQWNENMSDEYAISFVYQQQTAKCRDQALKFGAHDAKAVQKIIEEDALNLSQSQRFQDSVVSISLSEDRDSISQQQQPVVVTLATPAAA